MLLALETSTNVCSVAFKDERGEVYERRSDQRGSHSEQLFLFVEALMKEHQFAIRDLEAMLVSEGPGSYTGLRISASAAKGLLFQANVPLYGINTLAGFAESTLVAGLELQSIHSVIDARRVHLYHQKFNVSKGHLEAETEVRVLPISKVREMIEAGDTIIGTGIERIDGDIRMAINVLKQEHISAKSLIRLFEKRESAFIQKTTPERFNPKYYTSRQVE